MPSRLLYLLNVSNPGRLTTDSGWVFADLITRQWARAGLDVVVTSPVPVGGDSVTTVPLRAASTKYRARFGADMGELETLVRVVRPDVVVVNQIENAPAVRAVLHECSSRAEVVGYCHYLPFRVSAGAVGVDPLFDNRGLGHAVVCAFVAGLSACDRVLVHSDTARGLVGALAQRAGLPLEERMRIVPAPRDERLIEAAEGLGIEEGRKPMAAYNHRLYDHYGTAAFADLARRLCEAGAAVTVLDPFGVRSPARVGLDPSPERNRARLAALPGVEVVDGTDRVAYARRLREARVAFAPARPDCPWSMSVVDSESLGVPVVAPRSGWFAEHVPDELLYDDPDEAFALARRLIEDDAFHLRWARDAVDRTSGLVASAVAARFLEAMA